MLWKRLRESMYSKQRGSKGRILRALASTARAPRQKLLDHTTPKGVECAAR